MARILVIDDNESFRESVKDLLEAIGHVVGTAGDGEDGVRQFEQTPFDLIICDLFMPKKDGLETISEILRISPATPIISTTGHEASVTMSGEEINSNFLRAAREFGATHTLVKPFNPHEFLALVSQCLATRT
jgi:CheY-like chemotaxis protein